MAPIPTGIRLAKAALFVALLWPSIAMLGDLVAGRLDAEPYAPLIRDTGLWGLRLLLLGLAVTPLAHATGQGGLMRLRRMIGLFAAAYTLAHLALWAMDYGFAWGFLWDEILARRYLTWGFAAALLLVPLAATSWRGALKRLGGKRWQKLHRLVYPTVLLALWHTLEAHRLPTAEILLYGGLLAALLLWRLARERRPGLTGVTPASYEDLER